MRNPAVRGGELPGEEDREWANAANWDEFEYFSVRDSRLWVPRNPADERKRDYCSDGSRPLVTINNGHEDAIASLGSPRRALHCCQLPSSRCRHFYSSRQADRVRCDWAFCLPGHLWLLPAQDWTLRRARSAGAAGAAGSASTAGKTLTRRVARGAGKSVKARGERVSTPEESSTQPRWQAPF